MIKKRTANDREYLPTKEEVWLVFDCCNGDKPVKRYVWWFDTRAHARAHMDHYSDAKYAELKGPYKFVRPKRNYGLYSLSRRNSSRKTRSTA